MALVKLLHLQSSYDNLTTINLIDILKEADLRVNFTEQFHTVAVVKKLYFSSKKNKNKYSNLTPILKEAIDWDLIREYYDEVVKYIAALKTGTAEADVIIKRFSKDNYNHPVYKALTEKDIIYFRERLNRVKFNLNQTNLNLASISIK
jgi:hypothetical protein